MEKHYGQAAYPVTPQPIAESTRHPRMTPSPSGINGGRNGGSPVGMELPDMRPEWGSGNAAYTSDRNASNNWLSITWGTKS